MRGVLTCVLLAPAIGAITAAIAGRWADRLVIAAAAAVFAITLPFWFLFVPRGPEWQFAGATSLVPALGVSYSIGIDGLSLVFMVLTALLGLVAAVALGGERVRFGPALLLLETGVLGLVLTLDFVVFLASWLAAMTSAAMLLHRADVSGRRSRFLFATVAFGAATLLLGVLALYGRYHTVSAIYTFDMRPYRQVSLPPSLQVGVFLAFMPGLVIAPLVVVAQLARAATTSRPWLIVPALLVSNIVVYGVFRICLAMLPHASRAILPGLLGVALLIAGGAVVAVLLRRGTRSAITAVAALLVIAVAGLAALTPDGLTGVIVLQVALALSVGAIFLLGPARQHRRILLALPLFSLAGAPALAGFVGLRLTVEGMWPISRIVSVGTVLLAVAATIVLWRARAPVAVDDLERVASPRGLLELAGPVTLVALSVWIGLHPAPLLDRLETSIARVVMRVSPQHAGEVADCLAGPAPPPPSAVPGLPVGMVLTAPCAGGSK